MKTERALPDGCRLLGPEEGPPPLGSVVVEMHLATSAPAGQIRMIRDLLLDAAGRYQGFTRAA